MMQDSVNDTFWTLEKDTSNTHLTPMTLWMHDSVRQKFKKNCT